MKINSVNVKELQPIETIAITHIGNYSGICNAFQKLAAWAGENNLWAASPKMAGVYHDNPCDTPTEELRSEACLEKKSDVKLEEGMKYYTITGGKYFVMQVEVLMAEYGEAWKKVYTALHEKGHECDTRDHYELYVSCAGDAQDPNSPWTVDLCIPIK